MVEKFLHRSWHCLHLEGKTKASARQFSIQLSSNLMEIHSLRENFQLWCCLYFFFTLTTLNFHICDFVRENLIWQFMEWTWLFFLHRGWKNVSNHCGFWHRMQDEKKFVNYDSVEKEWEICIIGKRLLICKIHKKVY